MVYEVSIFEQGLRARRGAVTVVIKDTQFDDKSLLSIRFILWLGDFIGIIII